LEKTTREVRSFTVNLHKRRRLATSNQLQVTTMTSQNLSQLANSILRKLPPSVRKRIPAPPKAGEGVHHWIFRIALSLHRNLDDRTIFAFLAAATKDCGRDVPEHEIRDAINNSRGWARRPSSGAGGKKRAPMIKPKWPVRDTARISEILISPFTEDDLWDASPIRVGGNTPDAEWFIDRLFPDNPLLCGGWSNSKFTTAKREDLRGKLSRMSLIVPSPMTALLGKLKNPKPGKNPLSAHTLDNTGPREYLITEFDQGTYDEQTTIIWHLRRYAPLVMVVASAGKSRHAWFNCQGATEEMQLRFFQYAVLLGADPATWTRCQFVRMPMGWRAEKNLRQHVHYFNLDFAAEGQGQ
jgi:hypothetical protein